RESRDKAPGRRDSPAQCVLDGTAQIRLFVKLKLSWCARAGDRMGICFVRCAAAAPGSTAPGASRLHLPLVRTLVLRLIFVVSCGGARRSSLSLHAKFLGLVNFVVIYNDPP